MRRLRVSMSVREIVAAGAGFSRRDGSLSDLGVALDEISSLRAAQEPLVLRVEASGGTAAARSKVAGDWLCDEGGAEPVRLPKAAWRCSREAALWSRRKEWIDAWESCVDPAWMAFEAARIGVPRRLVAAAVLGVIEASIWPWAGGCCGEARAMREAVALWCSGRAVEGEVRAAGYAVERAAEATRYDSAMKHMNTINRSCAALANVVVGSSDSFAAGSAAHAVSIWGRSLPHDQTLAHPGIIRSLIPSVAVLRASLSGDG